ncbi:hypothetical protein T484DRAFT_1831879 [Baffinella frigidus]|nr:hypothetical protein T484DRAFT_1831879 [Cryptophyta sp. CCMP2293]
MARNVARAYFGTTDIYLVRAILQEGFFPAVISVAYNRNFSPSDAFAMKPEFALAWGHDCYFGPVLEKIAG